MTDDVVAETMAKEFAFFHRNLSKAIIKNKKIPVLRRLCSDDHRNNNKKPNVCVYCGRKGEGNSKEISLEQLIDSAAFIGVITSMGTLVNSHLSTSCSRLQKQGQSLAALSYNSYIDIVHSKLKNIATEFLEEHQCSPNFSEDEEEYAEATRVTSITGEEEEDEYYKFFVDDINNSVEDVVVKTESDEEKAKSHFKGIPGLVAIFNTNKFENQLTKIPLTGGALHAQALKYHCESKYINYKDTIPYTYKRSSSCKCVEALSTLIDEHNKTE